MVVSADFVQAGDVKEVIVSSTEELNEVKAMGRGQRQMCDTDKYGFRRKKKDGTFASAKTIKRVHGFQIGDMVKAAVSKYQGTHIGRLASVRASGSFSVKPKSGMIGSNYKYCQIIQHADSYNYTIGNAVCV